MGSELAKPKDRQTDKQIASKRNIFGDGEMNGMESLMFLESGYK